MNELDIELPVVVMRPLSCLLVLCALALDVDPVSRRTMMTFSDDRLTSFLCYYIAVLISGLVQARYQRLGTPPKT